MTDQNQDDAAAKAAAEKAAADKAAADKAAADKAAAEKAAADKAAEEKAAAEKKAAEEAAKKPPDKYTLKLPDDQSVAAEDVPIFEAVARQFGFNNETAQKYLDEHVAFMKTQQAALLEEVKADPELGGDHYAETLRLVTLGRNYVFPPGSAEQKQFDGESRRTGLGNQPWLMRALRRVGKLLAEDSPAHGSGGGGSKPKARTFEEQADTIYGKR